LHKKSTADPIEPNISAYRTFRNIYNRVVRASKKLYFDNNLKKSKKNPKKTWSLLKEAIGQPSKHTKIDEIVVENTTVTNPSEIASAFNNFFAGAPQNVVNSIPPCNVPSESYLPNKDYPEMQFLNTCQAEVLVS
jgi:hypothetical protein